VCTRFRRAAALLPRVTDLGDVIALLLGARERYRTVRATLSVRLEARKLRQQHGDLGEAPDVRDDLPETGPRAREGVVRVWLAPPDQIREEREGDVGGWQIGIRSGGNWWALDEGDAYSNEEEPEVDTDIGESTKLFFDPRPLVGALDLEVLGETEIAGRAAIRLRGARRAAQQPTELDFELHLTGDEFELDVDAERGVLLRKVARYGGVESSVEEMVEIDFDETFPPETFAPITDVPVRPDVEPRELSLREAAELVAFPVRIPPPLAEDWSLRTSYFPGDKRALEPESIILELIHEDSRHVWIAETAAGQPSQIETDQRWQTNQYAGRQYEVVRPEQRNGMQAGVRFEQAGTRILISSRDFDPDALLEVAAALARVD
jgi:hypothetical protein